MNGVYNIFHQGGVDTRRDVNARNTARAVSRYFADIKSPTVYLPTHKDLAECLAAHPQVRFNSSPDESRIFPGTTGAAGLWIGSYLAYKKFLSTDADFLLIFEDDVKLSCNFYSVLKLYMSELPRDWDVFSLLVPWDTLKQHTESHVISGKRYISHIYQDWSTGAYALSRQAARTIVKDIEDNGISHAIDFYLFNFRYNQQTPYPRFNSYNIQPGIYTPVKLSSASSVSYIGGMEKYKA